MPRAAPPLGTERLLLRAHRAGDLDARVMLYADAEAMRFIGGVQNREECWARIQRYAGHWALLGYGMWAAEAREDGAFLGELGLGRFERGLGSDFDDAIEVAWVLGARAHRRGLATEGMAAAIAWHEHACGPARLVAVIAHENLASLRVAAKLGFAVYAEREYRGAARLLLERLPRANGGYPEADHALG